MHVDADAPGAEAVAVAEPDAQLPGPQQDRRRQRGREPPRVVDRAAEPAAVAQRAEGLGREGRQHSPGAEQPRVRPVVTRADRLGAVLDQR
ncbi:hypothetical protein AB0H12_30050 [Actinosynnema sp. NPDC023794]